MVGAPAAELSLPMWRAERVLYDDQGLLVVDKPPHIPVYGGREGLAFGLTDRLGEFLRARGRDPRLGVHQRLDQSTSGVLLLTTAPGRDADVAQAIADRSLRRNYVAVCSDPARRLAREGTIALRLKQVGGSCVVSQGRDGKEAVTRFELKRRVGDRALVECELQTGRLHQIRVSLAHLGAPVVGDSLYNGPAAARLFLHARELRGGPLEAPIEAALPPGFAEALEGRALEVPRSPLSLLWDACVLRTPLQRVTTAFRLVNGEGDGLPGLTIDYYAGFAVLNVYREEWLGLREQLAAELLEMGCLGVYEKRRLRTDLRSVEAREVAPELPLAGQAAPSELLVSEGPLSMLVDLADGLSTGLFVDQRDNHQKTMSWCKGGRVLNLFCYSGAFSVAAALAGGTVTSVDLSGKALLRVRKNYELNQLDPTGHRFIKEDAMRFLARAERRGDSYDFIVLDPPSFSTVGKGTFSVRGRYREAADHCMKLLAPGGRLLCVTNHLKTSSSGLRAMLKQAAEQAGRDLRSLKSLPSGLDCPEGAEGPFPSKSVIVEVR